MKRKIPTFKTDEEAQRSVDPANLAGYDLSGLTPVQFEFGAKTAQLNMRVPRPLLDTVKASAKAKGIPYTRFIRLLMEQAVSKPR
jgi:predicted DNA binding CopG/RHH family protein